MFIALIALMFSLYICQQTIIWTVGTSLAASVSNFNAETRLSEIYIIGVVKQFNVKSKTSTGEHCFVRDSKIYSPNSLHIVLWTVETFGRLEVEHFQ